MVLRFFGMTYVLDYSNHFQVKAIAVITYNFKGIWHCTPNRSVKSFKNSAERFKISFLFLFSFEENSD